MSVRVVIVDDHAVVRAGIRLVLETVEEIDIVGEAGDAREAVFEVRAKKPDVILMDVTMPGKSGIEAIPDVLRGSRRQGASPLDGGRSEAGLRRGVWRRGCRLRAQGGCRH